MKPRKMQPRVMWAVLPVEGELVGLYGTRSVARDIAAICKEWRVVRVRVTEAP